MSDSPRKETEGEGQDCISVSAEPLHSPRDSNSTAIDIERFRKERVKQSGIEMSDVQEVEQEGGAEVDVEKAIAEFAKVARQLSTKPQNSDRNLEIIDPEKQAKEGHPTSDLTAYLRGESEKRDANKIYHKRLGVAFLDLSVTGIGGVQRNILTFPEAIKDHFMLPFGWIIKRLGPKPTSKMILSGFSGCVKPGEMCFVLGRPDAGCSTFLKVIANQRFGFLDVGGEVEYGGIDAKLMAKNYKGEVVYNPEDDIHHPTLTVRQTLDFALATKTPATRLPNQSKRAFQAKVAELLLSMLGITHTQDTYVGNSEVRGVSGGERKRVSIAEMMTTRACVCAWDNSTRGLDASTALQYARSLRILANIFKMTTFVSLYQAGEGIYDQFDKVCLISEGKQVYFGPASEARAYMISLGYKNLPRQTTADYLTGCTDPNERQFEEGVDPSKVPTTAEEMEKAYLESDICKRMRIELQEYKVELANEKRVRDEFMAAVTQDRQKGTSKDSPRTINFPAQIWTLIVRETQLKLQDRMGLMFSWATTICIAVVLGSLFLNLPKTSAGGFTRGGVIFVGLLFNVFISFTELPTQMLGRPVMWRQTSFCFYRPGALALANALADIPFTAPKIFSFCLIVYFMAGLFRSAGAFFTFYAIVYSTFLALSGFFRFLGAISFSFDTASRLSSALVIAIVVYSGYLIPGSEMKRWLVWIWYMNPVNWSFAALMGNEFGRVDLTCEGTYIVPNGPTYPSTLGPNQICTLRGARAGVPVVSGSDYIQTSFGYSRDHIWRNFGFEIAYLLLFLTLLYLAVENLALGAGLPAIHVFAKENEERKTLNERLQARKHEFRSSQASQDLSGLIQTRKPFTWEALTYDVDVSGGQKRLLDEIYGYVKPGTLTALMGSSGAGKTTLLDVLANRKNTGVVRGQICVSGAAPGPDFQRGTAYCEQQDVHEWTSTVREAFRFSAYLRQPAHVPIEEKNAYVEEVIQLLEMEDLADAMIGVPGIGLGVEARKRVTIGVELAAKPQLLLFLDEPTSGLDGQSAYNIVRFLRKLASAGQAILCTIHQPNALLFETFDRLLLLKKGGRCVYFGEIGKDSNIIRSYFEKQGALCPPDANPAEFMLEAIGAGSSQQMGGQKDWADRWLESEEHQANQREIEVLKRSSSAQRLDDPESDHVRATSYATSTWFQLKTVVGRASLAFYRNSDYQFTRVYNHATIGLIVGLTFLKVGDGMADLQYRVFALFVAGVLPALIMAQVEPAFILARGIHLREASSKMYSQEVFAISQFLAEMPYSILSAVVYYLVWYFPNGFSHDSNRAGYAFFMILLLELFSVTLGQAIAALSPSIFIASQVNPPMVVMLNLFCGVTVPQPSMPSFWRNWMYNLDPFTRFIAGLVVNELHDLKITCKSEEFSIFDPPSNETCESWTREFLKSGPGYIENPTASSGCQYCPYAVGDQFFEPLNYSYSNRWRDLGILVGYLIFNFFITVLAARFLTLRYAKR